MDADFSFVMEEASSALSGMSIAAPASVGGSADFDEAEVSLMAGSMAGSVASADEVLSPSFADTPAACPSGGGSRWTPAAPVEDRGLSPAGSRISSGCASPRAWEDPPQGRVEFSPPLASTPAANMSGSGTGLTPSAPSGADGVSPATSGAGSVSSLPWAREDQPQSQYGLSPPLGFTPRVGPSGSMTGRTPSAHVGAGGASAAANTFGSASSSRRANEERSQYQDGDFGSELVGDSEIEGGIDCAGVDSLDEGRAAAGGSGVQSPAPSPHVGLKRVRGSGGPAWPGHPKNRPVSPERRASNWETRRSGWKALADEVPNPRNPDDLEAAKNRGERTGKVQIDRAQVQRWIPRLAAALPTYALAAVLGMSAERLDRMEFREAAKELFKVAIDRGWHHDRVREGAHALEALFADLDSQEIDHRGRPEGFDVTHHLRTFARDQQDRHRARKLVFSASAAGGHLAAPAGVGATRLGKREQSGFYCGQNRIRGLKWVQKECAVELHLDPKWHPGWAVGSIARPPPVPSPPFTLGVLVALELFCVDPASHPVLAHIAAGMLLCSYGCMRFAQAQYCWVTCVRDNDIFEGYVGRDKNADPARAQSRPFWGSVNGLVTGDKWFRFWLASLSEVQECDFVFQDFRSSNGLAAGALFTNGKPRWLAAPLEDQRLIKLVREVLCAIGLTEEQALAFGQHSARHFLPEALKFRREEEPMRNEVGRWSMSVAQQPIMRPTTYANRSHRAQAAAMADLYARCGDTERVVVVLRRTFEALRTAVSLLGGGAGRVSNVPLQGGWDKIPLFVKNGDAFDV